MQVRWNLVFILWIWDPLAWFLTCRCFSVKFLILMITMKSWWSISWWFIQNLAAAAAPPTPCLGRGWVRLCLGGQCCSSKNISRSWRWWWRWWWLWSWWQWKWSGSEGGGHDFWISFEEEITILTTIFLTIITIPLSPGGPAVSSRRCLWGDFLRLNDDPSVTWGISISVFTSTLWWWCRW